MSWREVLAAHDLPEHPATAGCGRTYGDWGDTAKMTTDTLAFHLRRIAEDLVSGPRQPDTSSADQLMQAHDALLIVIKDLTNTITDPRLA